MAVAQHSPGRSRTGPEPSWLVFGPSAASSQPSTRPGVSWRSARTMCICAPYAIPISGYALIRSQCIADLAESPVRGDAHVVNIGLLRARLRCVSAGECDGMPSNRVACPDCGIVVTMSTGNEPITTITYDINDWRKRCKRIDFESPVWCLIARDGTFPMRKTKNRIRQA